MMGRKLLCLALALTLAIGLTACASTPAQPTTVPEETGLPQTDLDTLNALTSLLGLSDTEAADALGGGQENWTADKSFFIGRIYETALFDAPVKVFTSYNDDQTVASVSVWLTDGTREVAEDEVKAWVDHVSEYAGGEPVFDDTPSEAGSQSWMWNNDGIRTNLRWLGDIVTIDFQNVVGEIK